MVPGEMTPGREEIIINEGRNTCTLKVTNTGDRAIQVGSHFHFFEVNKALKFDREKAYGTHLDIASGTSVRFEPGEEKQMALIFVANDELLKSEAIYLEINPTGAVIDNPEYDIRRYIILN